MGRSVDPSAPARSDGQPTIKLDYLRPIMGNALMSTEAGLILSQNLNSLPVCTREEISHSSLSPLSSLLMRPNVYEAGEGSDVILVLSASAALLVLPPLQNT